MIVNPLWYLMKKSGGGGESGYLPPVGKSLDGYTWAELSAISGAGKMADYGFAAGDTKSITLNGTIGTLAVSNLVIDTFILGINHNSELEGKNLTHFQIGKINGTLVGLVDSYYGSSLQDGTKAFNYNHWRRQNWGGWKGSDVRYDILGSTNVPPQNYGKTNSQISSYVDRDGYDATENCAINPVENTFMSALPADLRAVIKPVTKYSNNSGGSSGSASAITPSVEYLFLLSPLENGFSGGGDSNERNYQATYDYYKSDASKIVYRHTSLATTAVAGLRSVTFVSGALYRSAIGVTGAHAGVYCDQIYAISPAFAIGETYADI